MIRELIKIANTLDDKGLTEDADKLDGIISGLAEGQGEQGQGECNEDDFKPLDAYIAWRRETNLDDARLQEFCLEEAYIDESGNGFIEDIWGTIYDINNAEIPLDEDEI